MSLKIKLPLFVFALVTALVASLYITASTVMFKGFTEVEVDSAFKDTHRAEEALSGELADLVGIVQDWARNTATYEFISGTYPYARYTVTNARSDVFARHRLNALIISDTEGTVELSQAVSSQTWGATLLPKGLLAALSSAQLLNGRDATSGLLSLPNGLALVATAPVLTSEGRGPARGTVAVVRLLDDAEIAYLAQLTQLPLSVTRGAETPSDSRAVLAQNGTSSVHLLSDDTLASFTFLRDVAGTPVGALRVETPRLVYAHAVKSRRYLLGLVGLVTLLFLPLLLWLLRGTLARFTKLSHSVQAVAAAVARPGHTALGRVESVGSDEITRLGRDINDMLAALERSQTDQRASEARYRDLFENANDLIYTHDLQGVLLSVNRAVERVTGYNREEAVGLNLTQVVAPAYQALVRAMTEQKVISGQMTTYELDILTKDGREVPLEVSTRLICEAGSAVAVQGVARDISDRRRSQDALRRASEKTTKVLESISDVFFSLDTTWCFTYINVQAEAFLNKSRTELLGQNVWTLFPEMVAYQFHDACFKSGRGWRTGDVRGIICTPSDLVRGQNVPGPRRLVGLFERRQRPQTGGAGRARDESTARAAGCGAHRRVGDAQRTASARRFSRRTYRPTEPGTVFGPSGDGVGARAPSPRKRLRRAFFGFRPLQSRQRQLRPRRRRHASHKPR